MSTEGYEQYNLGRQVIERSIAEGLESAGSRLGPGDLIVWNGGWPIGIGRPPSPVLLQVLQVGDKANREPIEIRLNFEEIEDSWQGLSEAARQRVKLIVERFTQGLPGRRITAEQQAVLFRWALDRIALGHLPLEMLDDSKIHTHVDPADRRTDYCRVCGWGQSPEDTGTWFGLDWTPDPSNLEIKHSRPELHEFCFYAWMTAMRSLTPEEHPNCPPEFTEYTLGISAEKGPLRFYGRILAHAEREDGKDTRRYVLYGTSDDQFVGEVVMVDNQQSTSFRVHQSFEELDRALAWFRDETLRAELQRQLAKSDSVK
jgi:hypothetical protein